MSASSTLTAGILPSALEGKRILVIDDDPGMLLAVTKVFRHAGADAVSAQGVADAVALLAQKDSRFDLVLTDLRMPVTSGKSILSMVNTAFPKVPVLIMSAFWTPELRDECSQNGATDFIEKPVKAASLLEAAERAISQAEENHGDEGIS